MGRIKYVCIKCTVTQKPLKERATSRYFESHDFFNGLNCGSSVVKPKNNGMLRKKNGAKGMILKRTRTRMAKDGED